MDTLGMLEDVLYTTTEAGIVVDVSSQTIINRCLDGSLRFIRHGPLGRRKIRRSDLAEYIENAGLRSQYPDLFGDRKPLSSLILKATIDLTEEVAVEHLNAIIRIMKKPDKRVETLRDVIRYVEDMVRGKGKEQKKSKKRRKKPKRRKTPL